MKIFLSYTKQDRKHAEVVSDILKRSGLIVWLDIESIKPGEVWRESIREAIENSDAFVALVSQDYIESIFCQMEFESALLFQQFNFFPIVIENVWDLLADHPIFHKLYSYPPLSILEGVIVDAASHREVVLFDKSKSRWDYEGPTPQCDVLLCSLPNDYEFAVAISRELNKFGLSAMHIAEYAGYGDYIGQLTYYAMNRAKYCAIVLSDQGVRLHDVVGRFALASEEMGVPVFCVSSPELHSNPAKMEQLFREINSMDRVFGRLLDRQVIMAWGDASQVARDLQQAFKTLGRSGRGSHNHGVLDRVLDYLRRSIELP